MNTDHEVIEALGILIIGTESEPLPGHQIHSGLGKSLEAHKEPEFSSNDAAVSGHNPNPEDPES